MSQSDGSSEAEIIKETTQLVLESYFALALAILLPVYEFVITFDQEVAALWMRGRKLTLASLLLGSTRWCMVISAVVISLPVNAMNCKVIGILGTCLQLIGFLQVAVFSALRVSAIWERSQILFLVVAILGSAPAVTNAYTAATFVYTPEDNTCLVTSGLSDRTNGILELATRIPVIIADVLVLVLTWTKTYGQVVTARRTGHMTSVSMYLFRDGTIYFVILLALNIVELITNRKAGSTIISYFTPSIPPILVNRFMLNLRQIDTENGTQNARRVSNFSEPQFRAATADSVFGNLGEPLDHGASLRGDTDEDEGENPGEEHGDASRAENENLAPTGSSEDIIEIYRRAVSAVGMSSEAVNVPTSV